MLRGVFINTGKANCSIFESGRMVYECLAGSEYYTLDYFSLDTIDASLFADKAKIRVLSEGTKATTNYDFWIFNWHHQTMASFLPVELLQKIDGLKFSIVLELTPEDPLALIPRGAFDGHIALDPDAEPTAEIFPFPRPLEWQPRRPERRTGPPLIGSFGFGTPGKGFELLVEAVNREFDRATVRVNIPTGTYTTEFDGLHHTNYPKHIERVCRRLAKPGIDVVFTYDFMSPEAVVDWCAENDLNCFMYTRKQPGLSATTDQAVSSGRPLLVLANDTFRHIHKYMRPYPETSLREALETHGDIVARVQEDWSRENFQRTFHRMLCSFGLLDPVDKAPSNNKIFQQRAVVLHAHFDADYRRDRLSYSKRLSDSLMRIGDWSVVTTRISSAKKLRKRIAKHCPDIVVLSAADELEPAAVADALRAVGGPKVVVSDAAERWAGSGLRVQPTRPIVPFYTVRANLRDGPQAIWLIGFADPASELEQISKKIAAELPTVDICIMLPEQTPSAFRERIVTLQADLRDCAGVRITPYTLPADDRKVVETLASGSLIVIHADPQRTSEIEGLASLALITERAVVFARAGVPDFARDGRIFEDTSVTDSIGIGLAAQIGLVAEFGEWAMAKDIRELCRGSQSRTQTSGEKTVDPKNRRQFAMTRHLGGKMSVADIIALPSDTAFLRAAYQAALGRQPDPVEMVRHRKALARGRTRERILFAIATLLEAKMARRNIPGLRRLLWRVRLRRLMRLRRLRPLPLIRQIFDKGGPSLPGPEASLRHSLLSIEARLKHLADKQRQTIAELIAPQPQYSGIAATPLLSGEALARGRIATSSTTSQDLFLMVGVLQDLGETLPDRVRLFAESCTGSRRVQLVAWNNSSRKLQRIESEAERLFAISDHEGSKLLAAQARGAWLLALDPVQAVPGSGDPVAIDAIMEAHRLGLRTAFVFHGADPLRRPENACQIAEAYDDYIQALLVADAILPVSESAMQDLNAILSQHQSATWGAPTTIVSLPTERPGWLEYVQAIDRALGAASPAERLTKIYLWIPSSLNDTWRVFSDGLTRALTRDGVAVIPVGRGAATEPIDSATEHPSSGSEDNTALRSVSADPAAPQAPNWVLVSAGGTEKDFAEAKTFATANDLRIAIILDEEASLSGDGACEIIVGMDKVLALSDKVYDDLYRLLLSWRGKVHSVEDRLKTLLEPGHIGRARREPTERDWNNYARSLRTELATDRLRDSRIPLIKSERDIYEAFPSLVRRPKLSLCLSTYNRAGWLKRNLENSYGQISADRQDIEVLVVDNASTDKTPEIAARFFLKPNFRYVRNRTNVGMLGNLAVTAQHAKGEYIWILGDDDLTRPGCINNVLEILRTHPDLALVYLNYGYTSEPNPLGITDLRAFLEAYNVLEPEGPDELSSVSQLAAKTENFFTAIYSHVYRRDHAMRSYCQDTSGRPFSSMLTCIPTAYYVLHYMSDEMAYWIGEPSLVVNSNVSWVDYGPLFDLEQLPRAWDLAERNGADPAAVDRRRANRLWLVAMMWKDIFENDRAGNSRYFDAARVLIRLKHLPEIARYVPELYDIYERAHRAGHPAALMPASALFGSFRQRDEQSLPNRLVAQ